MRARKNQAQNTVAYVDINLVIKGKELNQPLLDALLAKGINKIQIMSDAKDSLKGELKQFLEKQGFQVNWFVDRKENILSLSSINKAATRGIDTVLVFHSKEGLVDQLINKNENNPELFVGAVYTGLDKEQEEYKKDIQAIQEQLIQQIYNKAKKHKLLKAGAQIKIKGRKAGEFYQALIALIDQLKKDISKQVREGKPLEQILNSPAIDIMKKTTAMMSNLEDMLRENLNPQEERAAHEKIIKNYEQSCKRSPGWETFAKAIALVIATGLAFVAGFVAGTALALPMGPAAPAVGAAAGTAAAITVGGATAYGLYGRKDEQQKKVQEVIKAGKNLHKK